jgi:protein TonB
MYLFIASLFFYAQNHYIVSSKSEEKVIQLCMSSFQPEVVTAIEQEEQIEEIEQPIVEEEPVVEPDIIKEQIPEEEKEEVIPEPIVPKVTPKLAVEEVKKKPEVKKKTKKKTVKENKPRQKASARKVQISSAQKNQFLSNIRAKINKHKSYPRIAKKRGMQGSVNVKFTILSSGKVGNISVDGPKVFHSSARNAVQSAFPVDAKNAPISLPTSINIILRYQIR